MTSSLVCVLLLCHINSSNSSHLTFVCCVLHACLKWHCDLSIIIPLLEISLAQYFVEDCRIASPGRPTVCV